MRIDLFCAIFHPLKTFSALLHLNILLLANSMPKKLGRDRHRIYLLFGLSKRDLWASLDQKIKLGQISSVFLSSDSTLLVST